MSNLIHLNQCIKITSFSFLIKGSGKHVRTAIEFFTFKSFFNHLPGIQYDNGLSSKENTKNVAILLAQSFTTSTNIFHVYEWNMTKQWNSNRPWKNMAFIQNQNSFEALKLPGGNFRGLIEDLKIEMIKIVTMAATTMYNGDILSCVFLLSFG